MSQKKLIIFVKNEEAGKTKTRLAATIGDEAALDAYRKLLTYTFIQTKNLDVKKEVWYSRFKEKGDVWSEGSFSKKVQFGENLGRRMSNAFQDSFQQENFEKVVIIGSDCAELTSEIIEKAFMKLESNTFVLGPALDGGYYLLGMTSFYPQIFEDINWSTDSVLGQTLQKIESLGKNYTLLEELNDVDTIEDWEKVKSHL